MDEKTQQLLAKVSQALGIKLEHLMALINSQEQQEEGGGQKFLEQVIQVLQSGDENAINGLRQQVMEALGVPSEKNGGVLGDICPPGTSAVYAKNGTKICKKCEAKRNAMKGEEGMEVNNAFSFLDDPNIFPSHGVAMVQMPIVPYKNTIVNRTDDGYNQITEGGYGDTRYKSMIQTSTKEVDAKEFKKKAKELFKDKKGLFDKILPI